MLLPFASAPYNQANDTLHVKKAGDTMTGPLVMNTASSAAVDIQNGSGATVFKYDPVIGTLNQSAPSTAQDGAVLSTNQVVSVDFSNPTFWSPNSTTWTTTTTNATHVVGNTTVMQATLAVFTSVASDYLITFTISGMTNIETDSLTPGIGTGSGRGFRTNGTFKMAMTALAGGALKFTPSTNFDGTLSNVQIQQITNEPPRWASFNSASRGGTLSSELRSDFQGNTFIGKNSGKCLVFGTGFSYTIGDSTMRFATTAANNFAAGSAALQNMTSGSDCFALGGQALFNNVTGARNVAIGISALTSAVTANDMIAIGEQSFLGFIGATGQIVGVGVNSGRSVTRGANQLYIGFSAGFQETTLTAWKTLTNMINSGAIGANAQVQTPGALAIGAQGDNQQKLGFATTSPTNFASFSPVQYNVGTASRSTTTITGSGTTWTAAMVGSEFIFADGTKTTITAFGSTTSLTCADSGTVASQIYRIHKPALQVDGTNFRVGINNVAPTSSLHVTGSFAPSTLTTTTPTLTLDETHHTLFMDATSSGLVVSLPSPASCKDREYIIKKIDSSANPVVIVPTVGTIDGAGFLSLTTQYKYCKIQSDGTNWYIIGGN